MKREVELHVGGKRIPLNLFTKEIITNIVVGIVESLKDAAQGEEISLRVGAAGAAAEPRGGSAGSESAGTGG
jgi:hypothetical protein